MENTMTEQEIIEKSRMCAIFSSKAYLRKDDDNPNENKLSEHQKLLNKQENLYKQELQNWEIIKIKGQHPRSISNTDKIDKSSNGFAAVVWKNKSTNEIIIAFRGTDRLSDLTDDKRIMHYEEPDQVSEARTLYDNVLKENSNSKIFLTGHSLGGALAQHIAREKNCNAITFKIKGKERKFI